MKQEICNNLKCLNQLLREDYKLPVKVIISMVGVSENTWNSWIRDQRIPHQEKKEQFIRKFVQATQNADDFEGKSQSEIMQDLKEKYRLVCDSQSELKKEKIRKADSMSELLYILMDQR